MYVCTTSLPLPSVKSGYVNSVLQYCGQAYATEDKEEVRNVTKDYLTVRRDSSIRI